MEMQSFFPRFILVYLYREPQPQTTQKAPQHRYQHPSTENQNPKNTT